MSEPKSKGYLPLSPVTLHVLVALLEGPKHGYRVKREVEDRTEGVVRLGAGTLYQALQRLRREGLICETEPGEGELAESPRWRFYRTTPRGERVVRAELVRLQADLEYANATLRVAREQA
ncbi:MAG: PadR family transcriptional regulator [Gemmatimonadetes bacterium]|nr:PadR family transcriptional regulator [Gemmatimonadota bacterium]